jgi:hypothetical protein
MNVGDPPLVVKPDDDEDNTINSLRNACLMWNSNEGKTDGARVRTRTMTVGEHLPEELREALVVAGAVPYERLIVVEKVEKRQ